MELLTTKQAGERIGLSPRSIAMLVAAGKIRCLRMGPRGGMVRFTPEDLEAYLKACQVFGSRALPRPASSRRREKRNDASK